MAIANLLPDAARKAWGAMIAWIAHPVAVVIAAITKQRLRKELPISIHLVAIAVTFIVAGALVEWLLCKA